MTSTNNNIIVKATITWKTTSIDKKQEQHEMANDKMGELKRRSKR